MNTPPPFCIPGLYWILKAACDLEEETRLAIASEGLPQVLPHLIHVHVVVWPHF